MTSLHTDSDESKRVLAELVEELADRLASDQPLDIEVWIAGHAAHADDLRRLLPAARMMAELGRSADANTRSSPSASQVLDSIDGTLGDFKIGRELGRGGMGVVYEARQISLGRRVALKILPFAAVVDPRQVARFKNEAQAAGQLDHANIVDVIAVGCERGVHYYAMRFIDGVTLAEVIEELRGRNTGKGEEGRRGKGEGSQEPGARNQDDDGELQISAADAALSNPQSEIRNRKFSTTIAVAAISTSRATNRKSFFRSIVELAIPVAEALDHAHEVGVIHRDVKPSNLMLDGRGKIWLTDFGLARISSAHEMTVTGDLLGTLRYMSPEQALAKRVIIDHRTDIYSLGATLYELLTLQPVFRGHEKQELLRQIAFEDPRPLRRLDRAVPPELETIVLKALEKNPADRYATAKDLADDLRRFLDEKPIHARRPGMRQRAVKWGRRHISAVTAAVCVLLIAVVALVLSTYRIGIALQTARDAVTAEKKALVAATRAAELEKKARLAEEAKGRQAAAVTELLESAFTRLDPAAEQKGGPSIVEQLVSQLDEIAETLEKDYSGELLVRARLRNAMGIAQMGLGETDKAVELCEKVNAEYKAQLGPDHRDTLKSMETLAVAYLHVGQFDKALRLSKETWEKLDAKLGRDHRDTLGSMHNLAAAYSEAGQFDKALPILEKTLEALKLGPNHAVTLHTMNNLAAAYQATGQLDKALPLFEETHENQMGSLGPDHPQTLITINNLAGAYQANGQFDRSLPLFQQNLQKMAAKLGPDHPKTLLSMLNLASAYQAAGQLDKSLPLFKETLEMCKVKLGLDHPLTLYTMSCLASAYQNAGQSEAALPLMEETLDKQEAMLGFDHPDTLFSMNNLAVIHWSMNELDQSIPLFEQALALKTAKLGESHVDTLITQSNLGVNYRDAGRVAEGIELMEKALELATAGGKPLPAALAWIPTTLGATYDDAGEFAKAEPLLRALLEQARKLFGADDPTTAGRLASLGLCLLHQQKYAEAEALVRECLAIREQKLPDDWTTFGALSILGGCLLGQGKHAQAEPLLLAGYEGVKEREAMIPPGSKYRLTEALERVVKLYEVWNKPDQAAQWRQKLDAVLAKTQAAPDDAAPKAEAEGAATPANSDGK